MIDLTGAKILPFDSKKQGLYAFQLVSAHQGTFYIAANSEALKFSWMRTIAECINRIKKQTNGCDYFL